MDLKYVSYDEYKEEVFKKNPEIRDMYEEMSLKYQIIHALIEYRKKHNMTQAQLAKKIGISRQALSKLERGKINSRIDLVEKVLKSIGYTIVLKEKSSTSV